MNIEDVKKLIDAGFSAEEIRSMMNAPSSSSDMPEAAPAEAPEAPQEAAPEVKTAPAAPAFDIAAEVKKALQPFEDLYNKMSMLAGMPSIQDVQPKGIDDIITKFFEKE